MPPKPHEIYAALALREHHKSHKPSMLYGPEGDRLAFHEAPHTIRALFLGNGWGKTTSMGLECDAWVSHTNRWQPTPDHPVVIKWFCEKYAQFDNLRLQLEAFCLTRGYSWNENKHRYEWPKGDLMVIGSYDGDWKAEQGIAADLICFDELPPMALWREMQMRKRGQRDTRYIIAATATQSGHPIEPAVFTPWLKHHEQMGLDQQQAIQAQQHPFIWCLPRGGIDDNPHATPAQRAHFHAQVFPSEKEKQVRLHGGFQNWSGDCIFDEAGLDWIDEQIAEWEKQHRGINGSFAIVREDDPRRAPNHALWDVPTDAAAS